MDECICGTNETARFRLKRYRCEPSVAYDMCADAAIDRSQVCSLTHDVYTRLRRLVFYLSADEIPFEVRTQFDPPTAVGKQRQQRLNSISTDTENTANEDKTDKNLIHSVVGTHGM